jgi:hypothetical protein
MLRSQSPDLDPASVAKTLDDGVLGCLHWPIIPDAYLDDRLARVYTAANPEFDGSEVMQRRQREISYDDRFAAAV